MVWNKALSSYNRRTKKAFKTAKGYLYELKDGKYSYDNTTSKDHKHSKGDAISVEDKSYRSGFINGFKRVNYKAKKAIRSAFYQGRSQGYKNAKRARRFRRY